MGPGQAGFPTPLVNVAERKPLSKERLVLFPALFRGITPRFGRIIPSTNFVG